MAGFAVAVMFLRPPGGGSDDVVSPPPPVVVLVVLLLFVLPGGFVVVEVLEGVVVIVVVLVVLLLFVLPGGFVVVEGLEGVVVIVVVDDDVDDDGDVAAPPSDVSVVPVVAPAALVVSVTCDDVTVGAGDVVMSTFTGVYAVCCGFNIT